jgi:flagellar biosynthesis/type III secretory pathway protein FliH
MAWQPAELDLTILPVLGLGDQSGLAAMYLGEVHTTLQAAQARTKEILRAAEARAAQTLAAAEALAAEIVRRAEGQANSVTRQGYSDGMAAANAEMAELLRTTSSIVEETHAWREELYAQGELMMLRLVIEIAQTIFGDGLPLDPETLGGAFSRALAQAKTLGDLRIYVHPEDAAVLGTIWAQQQSVICGQRIELIPSDIIKRGGCFIEGQYGAVDSRVESQFKLVQDTLLAAQTAAQEHPPEGLS